jgi:uncharacterized protein YdhG (YjbR/CyaY superfamily)
MKTAATTPSEYIAALPDSFREPFEKLRRTIQDNLPSGFVETMTYGMITFAVPHSLYPAGYHCDPALPVPFISIAAQKRAITLYHHGLYADASLAQWFRDEYARRGNAKLDMGKSCVRFKPTREIPYDLIAELARGLTPRQWIDIYEKAVKRS